MDKRKKPDVEDDEPTPGCSSWSDEESTERAEKVRIIFSGEESSSDEGYPEFLSLITLDEVGDSEEEPEPEIKINFEGSDVEDWEEEDPAVAAEDAPTQQCPKDKVGKFCHVCQTNVRQRLRRHAVEYHVPWWLSPNRACWSCQGTAQSATFASYQHQECPQVAMVDSNVPHFVELANGLLRTLQEALGCESAQELLKKVVKEGWYPQSHRAAKLSFQQKMLMWLWEKENRMEITPFGRMSISPPYCVANLLHFKVLLLILPHVPEETRQSIHRGTYTDPGNIRRHLRRVVVTSDAHCHVGHRDLRGYHGSRWQSTLRVTTLISNFAFPSGWAGLENVSVEDGIFGTVGLHPTFTMRRTFIHPRVLNELRSWLQDPRCIALGEVGLDYVRGPAPSQQVLQRRNLMAILECKPAGMPLILHCRGGEEAFEDLADIVGRHHPKEDPIMLHCFLGTTADRDLMGRLTKRLYVSVSPKSLKLPVVELCHLESALRGVELDRLLLETDYPFLSSDPRQDLQALAHWLGGLKGVCASLMLEANRRNVARLFHLE